MALDGLPFHSGSSAGIAISPSCAPQNNEFSQAVERLGLGWNPYGHVHPLGLAAATDTRFLGVAGAVDARPFMSPSRPRRGRDAATSATPGARKLGVDSPILVQ